MNRFIKTFEGRTMKEKLHLILEKVKMFFSDKKRRERFIWISSLSLAVMLLVSLVALYLGDYYRADTDSIEAFESMSGAEQRSLDDGTLVFESEGARVGLIFYPGGKVEYTAYMPLMAACTERGILAVLVEMPFNLAVLDMNAADGIREQFPEIERWYIGGHSLGGSMAASYLAKNSEHFSGLLLLGSYSTANLQGLAVDVISLYGSNDGVMNREKYEKYKKNLPEGFAEVVIDGGNHAYFGMYGEQSGDGAAGISATEQILITAEKIASHIFNKE